MAEEYIIKDNGFTLTFLKNGFRHRKDGPALIWKKNQAYLPNKDEQKLYTIKFIQLEDSAINYLASVEPNSFETVSYYLEGESYSENQFKSLLLNEELDMELQKTTKKENKKTKV